MLLPPKYELLAHQLGDKLKFDVSIASHTYFKLGGPADLFYEANSLEELTLAVSSALTAKVPFFVIGSGSNLIVSDKGFRGLMIKNKASSLQLKGFTGSANQGKLDLKEVIVKADSGVPANQLIRFTLDEELAGLEIFLGLPGTVGGAIYNNSHHLGEFIGGRVVEVVILTKEGTLQTLARKEMKFAYDYSILHQLGGTILSVSFLLKRGDKDQLWEIANSAVKRRATTQPLGLPSSGCIFRNVPLSDAMRLGTPEHTTSAGYLIDKAGLKGKKIGGASVSDVHANFIVNDGSATTKDVLELIELVKREVKLKFGVKLELEVFLVGES